MSAPTRQELQQLLDRKGAQLPMRALFQLALASLRVRLTQSLITLTIILLAITYLCFSGLNNALIRNLAAAGDKDINNLLRAAKINVDALHTGDQVDQWLLIMAFATCMVGISNAMLMTVTQRFRDIGTMKCLGAEDHTVVKLFLIESSLTGMVGSILGILVGVLLCLALGGIQFGRHAFVHFPLGSLLSVSCWSFVAGLVLCLIAAGYPALIAAKMRPVEALRVEE